MSLGRWYLGAAVRKFRRRLRANYVRQRGRDQRDMVALFVFALQRERARYDAAIANAERSASIAVREVERVVPYVDSLAQFSVRIGVTADIDSRLFGRPPYRLAPELAYHLLRDVERALLQFNVEAIAVAQRRWRWPEPAPRLDTFRDEVQP